MSKLKEMLAAERLSDDKKALVSEIRKSFSQAKDRVDHLKKKTFSPSTLSFGHGVCPRYWKIAFDGAFFETSIDQISMDRMESGTFRHEKIQEQMSSINRDVVFEQELMHEDPPIRGFADAVIDGIPVEIKTMGVDAFAYRASNFSPAIYHKLQLIIYCMILDSDIGLFIYENRDTFEKKIIPLFMDEENVAYGEYLFDWMRKVKEAHKKDELPTFFKGKRSNSKICQTCPVKSTCDSLGQGVVDIPLLENPR